MTDWKITLAALRAQFLEGSKARLDRVEANLRRLRENAQDTEALTDLRLAFHGFSGLGGSYGFPRVTLLGRDGEKQCDEILAGTGGPGEAELTTWSRLLEDLRSDLGQEGAAMDAGPEPAPARRREALVVEPDLAERGQIALIVERAGLAFRGVGSRVEALAALEDGMPDAVLVDADLSDGSGYALVERIRSTPGGEAAAVLLLGGAATVLDRVEAIHCGADGLFEKPIDAEAVERRLQQLLERAAAETPRILSVEDDPDQAVLIRSYLESAGYEVAVVETPREFEEALIAFRPHLVLMDILLPGKVSGYDLARYLRQDDRYAMLPILFLTAQRQMDVRIETVRAGGDDHLAKPIVPGLLLSTVAARLERARFLKDLVERDGLTRLLAHTAFLERVRAAHGRKVRRPEGPQAALVELDLDHFKTINDTWGHPAGDRVLTALAALLRSRLRQSDSIGRLGGEEFGILIEDLSLEEAVRLVDRLREDFARIEHRGHGDATFRSSFSAGVAMSSGAADLPGWLGAADAALYDAKHGGRNRVAVFRPFASLAAPAAQVAASPQRRSGRRRPGRAARAVLVPVPHRAPADETRKAP